MKKYNSNIAMKINKWNLVTIFLLICTPFTLIAQQGGGQRSSSKITLGVHADPLISWFSSDIDSVKNDGARSGFNFGLTVNYFFKPNYAFSTGLNLISAGGRLSTSHETTFDVTSGTDQVVAANTAVVYKIQYLSVPIGLKLQTNQIGYITFFTDLGLDPKVVIGTKVNIGDLENQKAPGEVRTFNVSYHAIAGIEYAVGGNTAFVIGIGFDNNFADITNDYTKSPFNQPEDKISHKMISVRLGVNF